MNILNLFFQSTNIYSALSARNGSNSVKVRSFHIQLWPRFSELVHGLQVVQTKANPPTGCSSSEEDGDQEVFYPFFEKELLKIPVLSSSLVIILGTFFKRHSSLISLISNFYVVFYTYTFFCCFCSTGA